MYDSTSLLSCIDNPYIGSTERPNKASFKRRLSFGTSVKHLQHHSICFHLLSQPSNLKTSSASTHHPGPLSDPVAPGTKLSCIPSVNCHEGCSTVSSCGKIMFGRVKLTCHHFFVASFSLMPSISFWKSLPM